MRCCCRASFFKKSGQRWGWMMVVKVMGFPMFLFKWQTCTTFWEKQPSTLKSWKNSHKRGKFDTNRYLQNLQGRTRLVLCIFWITYAQLGAETLRRNPADTRVNTKWLSRCQERFLRPPTQSPCYHSTPRQKRMCAGQCWVGEGSPKGCTPVRKRVPSGRR